MEEPLIYREEVTAVVIVLADISANVIKIRRILEDGEEEEDLEQ